MVSWGEATFDSAAKQQPRFQEVAVLLPCLNEAAAITGVVAAFKSTLPGAPIYVIDNGSVDATRELAKAAGAQVIIEKEKGKGNAVRRAFATIDAEFYIVADGDGTYDAAEARWPKLRLMPARRGGAIGATGTAIK